MLSVVPSFDTQH